MISKNIKSILKNKGKNLRWLASQLDMQPESLSRMINGNPTLESLSSIAKILDVQVYELFDASEPNGYIEYKGEIHRIKSVSDLDKLMNTINS